MIDETLSQIEGRIQGSTAIKPEQRKELIGLLSNLRSEISDLSQTHAEEARSIAGFAGISAHEVTRGKKDPNLTDLSIEGFAASVKGFEESHPRLVDVVNRICTALSNMGI